MLPDLTHPLELVAFAELVGKGAVGVAIALLALGLVLALFARALGGADPAPAWARGYDQLLRALPHAALALVLLGGLGAVCSTLANRAHHWEQDHIAAHARQVDGGRMEQPVPTVRYAIEEPYTVQVVQAGKPVELKRTRTLRRTVPLAGSAVDVVLEQLPDPVTPGKVTYKMAFKGDFEVTNPLIEPHHFEVVLPRPSGTTVLSGFKVEANGQRLTPVADDANAYAVDLAPNERKRYTITYEAQGGPRWIFDAQGQALSNFKLTTHAKFGGARFASGVAPSTTSNELGGTVFTWDFKENVAVANPFGVFTAIAPVDHAGVVPRLLFLAPGICAWWLLVLYLSAPPSLRQLPVAVIGFFSMILTLGYLSRAMPALVAWVLVAAGLLALAYALEGRTRAVVATFVAAALPLLALLLDHTGLTLSVAAVLSAGWLAVSNRAGDGIKGGPVTP
ncbi:MAG: hypothetical protein JWM80_1275 [Cyanobacteria bacterium RYN_339]|nr:hypothetical protein [Cyanobacteria bacterium RYN_339]